MKKFEIKEAQKNLKRLNNAGFTLIELINREIKSVNSVEVFLNNEYSITIFPPEGVNKQLMFFRYDLEKHRNRKIHIGQMIVVGRQSYLSLIDYTLKEGHLTFGYHLFQNTKGQNKELKGSTFNFDEKTNLFRPSIQ